MTAEKVKAVPADGEEFDLVINHDIIDLMGVVLSSRYIIKGWTYIGPEFRGEHRYYVKLMYLGNIQNLGEAERRVREMGYLRLLEGQAREVFTQKYPHPDDRRHILFGGSQWKDWRNRPRFACLNSLSLAYERNMRYANESISGGNDRWAVVVREEILES